MLQLTKRTEYALIALVHMVDREGECVSVRELCERYPLPRRLVAEVLKDLCRMELVESHRGSQGGYSLAHPAESITLGQIVSAMEGKPSLTSCESMPLARLFPGRECEVVPTCPIRSPIHRLREHLWSLMESTTLRALARSDRKLATASAGGASAALSHPETD
jgi:Rrf2 family nitric oxide-sensitive transcriptional repressor